MARNRWQRAGSRVVDAATVYVRSLHRALVRRLLTVHRPIVLAYDDDARADWAAIEHLKELLSDAVGDPIHLVSVSELSRSSQAPLYRDSAALLVVILAARSDTPISNAQWSYARSLRDVIGKAARTLVIVPEGAGDSLILDWLGDLQIFRIRSLQEDAGAAAARILAQVYPDRRMAALLVALGMLLTSQVVVAATIHGVDFVRDFLSGEQVDRRIHKCRVVCTHDSDGKRGPGLC